MTTENVGPLLSMHLMIVSSQLTRMASLGADGGAKEEAGRQLAEWECKATGAWIGAGGKQEREEPPTERDNAGSSARRTARWSIQGVAGCKIRRAI